MLQKLIAYNINDVEKHKVLMSAQGFHNQKFISDSQFEAIKAEYSSPLYTPNFLMKILLFIGSFIGLTTTIIPFSLIFLDTDLGEFGYRLLAFLLGCGILWFTESVLIKQKNHYKSGITEAGLFSSICFITFAIADFDFDSSTMLFTISILTFGAALRYLSISSLVAHLIFFSFTVFTICNEIDGWAMMLLPFILMGLFAILFIAVHFIEKRLQSIVFENQFIIGKVFALLGFYVAGNYYVVRELSISLLDLSIEDGSDIPFALVFYIFTAAIPLIYLYWGIITKSILLIRTSLLTIALSIITFKIYFSLGMPVVSITLAGAILIIIALSLMHYLKTPKNGFTRKKIFNDKWSASSNLTAFVASQTLGGNQVANDNKENLLGGGQFGGAGAGSQF